jgi:hypothetical protein
MAPQQPAAQGAQGGYRVSEKPKVWLTMGQVEVMLGLSANSIRRKFILPGALTPSFKTPGGHARFDRDEVVKLALAMGIPPPYPY